MYIGYSHKQILHAIGIQPDDLDHQSAMLLSRLYPTVADSVYLVAIVLLLRQKDGAIAIPWPQSTTDQPHGNPTVLDLLTDNLPKVKAGLQPAEIRTSFPETGNIALSTLLDAGAITAVSDPQDNYENAVMLLDKHRLYLRRFWRYEVDVAEMVRSRSVLIGGGDESTGGKDITRQDGASSGAMNAERSDRNVENGKGETDPKSDAGNATNPGNPKSGDASTDGTSNPGGSTSDNTQHQAVLAGLNYRFTVITGGPGTGKTHSVLMLLATMLERNPELRIVLCAPTGKAAARMMESIQGNIERINPSESVRALIPNTASTIHRLIRWNPALGKSVYHPENPLPYDVVILDEASMVDVALMSRLARALRPETRLILLGDKDQLSSVEAGSVFADIASRDVPNVVRLTKSWRFSEGSEIGRLAQVINHGDAARSWEMLEQGTQVTVKSIPKEDLYVHLYARISALYKAVLNETDHVKAFEKLQELQILTALRVGPFGSEQINAELDRRIGKGVVWYDGRPVIATANNYDLEVYNGDIGLTRIIDGRLMVAFAGSESGAIRWIAPAQLKSVSSAWALTVHKSQGSEYDEVVFVLPDNWNQVLSRELIYTALTRARNRFEVFSSKNVWFQTLQKKLLRESGLSGKVNSI
ncbi:MAG: AAA family ATPase [Bacteroidetes bacterium]|nr:AAA family ATPase [Bacteroidota bacterium]